VTHPTYELSFQGELLQRGLWLYVWEITTATQARLYYVGRTGESSSLNAQSPIARISHHFGFNESANVIRRHLMHKDWNVKPEECSFRLVAYEPILEEANGPELYRAHRDLVAALEKALADAMREAGYSVINTVHYRTPVNAALFAGVRTAFAVHFPKLQSGAVAAEISP
jgi:hypothetical protein